MKIHRDRDGSEEIEIDIEIDIESRYTKMTWKLNDNINGDSDNTDTDDCDGDDLEVYNGFADGFQSSYTTSIIQV